MEAYRTSHSPLITRLISTIPPLHCEKPHTDPSPRLFAGDYLVSGRHMSTIYRISGVDGHIIWRLGGCYKGISDFSMEEGLPFFWQHHARIRSENATHLIISLFDNESEDMDRGFNKGHTPPVGKIIVLDTASRPMTAKKLRRFDRPDGKNLPRLTRSSTDA